MERLRAGIIGVGAIAQMMHLPYLRELDDRFQIVALCDVDPVALAEVGRRYGVTRLFASAAELLAEPLDVVFILTSGDHTTTTTVTRCRSMRVLPSPSSARVRRVSRSVGCVGSRRSRQSIADGRGARAGPRRTWFATERFRMRDAGSCRTTPGTGPRRLPVEQAPPSRGSMRRAERGRPGGACCERR